MSTPESLDQLRLDNQVCFLVYRLHRGLNDVYRPLLGELGLTYPQYLVMLVLWERGALPVGELARLLDLDTGTLSPLLRRMATAGLVIRTRSPHDERSVIIAATPAGSQLRDRAADIPAKVGACLFDGLGDLTRVRDELAGLVERLSVGARESPVAASRTI